MSCGTFVEVVGLVRNRAGLEAGTGAGAGRPCVEEIGKPEIAGLEVVIGLPAASASIASNFDTRLDMELRRCEARDLLTGGASALLEDVIIGDNEGDTRACSDTLF